MKKHLIDFYTSKMNGILESKNSMSEEDAKTADAVIAELQTLIDGLKSSEEETDINAAIAEMKKELDSKLEAINEKIEEKEKENPTQMENVNNYLASENAIHDFATIMRTAKSANEMNTQWSARLSENGITFAEGSEWAYLPDAMKGAIQDAWEKNFPFLGKLKNTGAKVYAVRYTETAQDASTARAKGHKPGNTKTEQSLAFKSLKVDVQFIYKIATLSNMTIFEDDGSLVRYIGQELGTQMAYEIARCITVGDGRADDSDDKIDSITPILTSTDNAWVSTMTDSSANFLIDELVGLVGKIDTTDGNDVELFLSKSDITALRRVQASETSTPVYMPLAQVADMIGVAGINECSWLDASTARAIAFRPSKYVTVGQMQPKLTVWEDYKKNEMNYRLETPFGGHAEGLKMGAVLLPEE